MMPGGHLDLDHRIHEHALRWADIGEELLGQPAHPCKHLAQVWQPLLAWKMLLLGNLVHEKREDFARLLRAIGGCQASRLEIHLPSVAEFVALGERMSATG